MPLFDTMIIYTSCVLYFEFIFQILHYKHRVKTKKVYYLGHKLLINTKNGSVLQFPQNFNGHILKEKKSPF